MNAVATRSCCSSHLNVSSLSEKFYGKMSHCPHLAKYNNTEDPDLILVDHILETNDIIKEYRDWKQ